jgi:hypothetical protein
MASVGGLFASAVDELKKYRVQAWGGEGRMAKSIASLLESVVAAGSVLPAERSACTSIVSLAFERSMAWTS